MSVTHNTLDDTLIPQFDLSRVGVVTGELLKDVVPLFGAKDWADDTVIAELKSFTSRFIRAVEIFYLALVSIINGEYRLFGLLTEWERCRQNLTLGDLETTCRYILLAQANLVDAETTYQEARIGVQSVFNRFMEERGPDVLIRIESVNEYYRTGKLNIEHITVAKVAGVIIGHIEEAEKLAQDFHAWLSQMYTMLQTFLQDETATLDIPLLSAPFVSPNWAASLLALREHLREAKAQIMVVQFKNSDWFTVTYLNIHTHFKDDQETRWDSVQPPPSKVKFRVEEDVQAEGPPVSLLPARILENVHCGDSGLLFSMTLTVMDQTRPGKSTVAISFDFSPIPPKTRYSKVTVSYQLRHSYELGSLSSSTRITDHHPKRSEDLNPHRRPTDWTPQMRASRSRFGVEWSFYQKPFGMLNSSAPFIISPSLDIDHDDALVLEVHVNTIQQRYILPNRVHDFCCNIGVPLPKIL